MATSPIIYRKTAKGLDAMANRQSGLAPRLRSLLLLVDGKRTKAELLVVAEALGGPEQLARIEEEGLIEPLVAQASAAQAPSPRPLASATASVPAPVAAMPRAASMAEAQRFTSRLLEDTIGPAAEALCIRLEKARDLTEFIAAVRRAREVVREIKGSAHAEKFIAQIEAQMPAT
ncbi:MAG: hypothetical protein V4731_04495 [Pseudomonadota bacterium]